MQRVSRTKKARLSLEEMKSAREKGGSRLESLDFNSDDDVYELVDEEKYQKIVEDRRKAADFVVDDSKLQSNACDAGASLRTTGLRVCLFVGRCL